MSEAPKIPRVIRERLQVAATKAAEHPETNLLSAFAENVLAAGERSQVVRHLATCADCRDVVAMTVASRGIESPVAAEVRSPRWRVLRWAALGASAAAMLAVVAVYQQKPRQLEPSNSRIAANGRLEQAPAAAPALEAQDYQDQKAAARQKSARKPGLGRAADALAAK